MVFVVSPDKLYETCVLTLPITGLCEAVTVSPLDKVFEVPQKKLTVEVSAPAVTRPFKRAEVAATAVAVSVRTVGSAIYVNAFVSVLEVPPGVTT